MILHGRQRLALRTLPLWRHRWPGGANAIPLRHDRGARAIRHGAGRASGRGGSRGARAIRHGAGHGRRDGPRWLTMLTMLTMAHDAHDGSRWLTMLAMQARAHDGGRCSRWLTMFTMAQDSLRHASKRLQDSKIGALGRLKAAQSAPPTGPSQGPNALVSRAASSRAAATSRTPEGQNTSNLDPRGSTAGEVWRGGGGG